MSVVDPGAGKADRNMREQARSRATEQQRVLGRLVGPTGLAAEAWLGCLISKRGLSPATHGPQGLGRNARPAELGGLPA